MFNDYYLVVKGLLLGLGASDDGVKGLLLDPRSIG
jgi:hypothetical protein